MRGKLFKGAPNLSRNASNLADPTTLYNGIAESPQVARQFMDALANGKQEIAKGTIMDKIISNATDSASGSTSWDKVINQFQSPGYREIYTAKERSDLENMFRAMRKTDPSDLTGTSRALGWQHG